MIVSIIDIMKSTRIRPEKRKEIFKHIDLELQAIKTSWQFTKIGGPQRIQSDTIELASNYWLVHAQLIHFLLTQEIKIYVGIGAYKIHIWYPDDINKCDGPAFWNAKRALEEAKDTSKEKDRYSKKRKIKDAICISNVEVDTPLKELQDITSIIIYTEWLCKIQLQSRRYLYEYIWKTQSINEIAKKFKTSFQNVNQIINKNSAKQLKKIIEIVQRIRK